MNQDLQQREQLYLRVKETSKLFTKILKGKKPKLPVLLIKQLNRMETEGYLSEKSFQYYDSISQLNDENYTMKSLGKTHIHPLPVNLARAQAEIHSYFKKVNVSCKNVLVAGADNRNKSLHQILQNTVPEVVIVVPGDIYTAAVAMEIFSKILNRTLPTTSLIWINSDGYWNNLLKHMNFFSNINELATFKIEEFPSVSTAIENLLKLKISDAFNWISDNAETINEERIIFFNTTSPNKIRDLQRICRGLRFRIRVLPIAVLTDGPVRTAEEQSASYQGNLEEKFAAAIVRIHELGEEFITLRLNELGIPIQAAYLCVHDCGVSVPSEILDHMQFDCLRQERTPIKLGVESKFALHQFHGAQPLINAINNTYEEFQVPPEKRVLLQQDTAAFYPLMKAFCHKFHAPDYYYSCRQCLSSRAPCPYSITPEYLNFTTTRGKTLAEWARHDLESFAQLHPFGNIIDVFGKLIGLQSKHAINEKILFIDQFRITLLVVDIEKSQPMVENLRVALNDTLNFVSNIQIIPDHSIELQDKIFANSDAFIFVPTCTEIDSLSQWKRIFAFYSILVGLELEDPYLANKQVILYDPDGTNFKPECEFYTSLYNNGMSSQPPDDMYFVASSANEVIQCLTASQEGYRRLQLPRYERLPVNFPDKRGRFNVALYLSASSENLEYLEFTKLLAVKLVEQGFGIVSGGAAQGPMGAIHEPFTDALKQRLCDEGRSLINVGIYTRETKLREGIPKNKLTWSHEAPDIYYRMDLMEQYSDAFVILPGGKGIMQEISKLMISKCNNHETTRNKHIIVYNWQIELLRDAKTPIKVREGFYDHFLKMFPSQQDQRQWFHVFNSIDGIIQKLEEFRMEKKMADR